MSPSEGDIALDPAECTHQCEATLIVEGIYTIKVFDNPNDGQDAGTYNVTLEAVSGGLAENSNGGEVPAWYARG